MNDVAAKSEAQASYAKKAWQSDIIVDLIKHYGFPYIALNPGASADLTVAVLFARRLQRLGLPNILQSARNND